MTASLQWYYTGDGTSLGSLGGANTTTPLTTGIQNLFDNVTAAEAEIGDTEYRCLDLCAIDGSVYDILLYNSETTSIGTDLKMAFEMKLEVDENHIPLPKQSAIPDEGHTPDTIYDAVWLFHSGAGTLPHPEIGDTVWATRDHAVTGIVLAVSHTRIVIRGTFSALKFLDGDIIETTDGTKNVEAIMDAEMYSRAFATWTDTVPLDLPTLHSGERCRIWFKRTVGASTASTASDSSTITVEYIAGEILTSTSSSTTA